MAFPRLDRVWAFGRDTYVRFYPNPGVGICLGQSRVAVSRWGGFEKFIRKSDGTWRRTYALGSRRKGVK
jgi:hypothetical protein